MISVDKKIPLPEAKGRGNKMYPWEMMEIGDSFLMSPRSHKSAGTLASNAGFRYHRKFTTRRVEDGIRIWRIA